MWQPIHKVIGWYGMTLSDLTNTHYTNIVKEALKFFTLGRGGNEVAVGDIVEMLLSTSFACKDAMLDWLCMSGIAVQFTTARDEQRIDDPFHRRPAQEDVSRTSVRETSCLARLSCTWDLAVIDSGRCLSTQCWIGSHS